MLLRHVGARRLADLVESRQAHVRYLERRIDDTGLFVCLNDVDFYRLAFVLCPPEVRQVILALDPERRRRAARIVSGYTSRLNTARTGRARSASTSTPSLTWPTASVRAVGSPTP